MAQTTYRSRQAINTAAERETANELLALMIRHLHNLNLNLVSVVVTAPPVFVEVTLSNPIPVVFENHFKVNKL